MGKYNDNQYYKFFLEQFQRQEQFITDKKIIITMDKTEKNKIEFYLITNFEYEKNICIFKLSNQKVLNKILFYLLRHNYNIKYEIGF